MWRRGIGRGEPEEAGLGWSLLGLVDEAGRWGQGHPEGAELGLGQQLGGLGDWWRYGLAWCD